MNIFKTFELFLRKPMSILKHGLVSIVHIKSENLFAQKAINVDMINNKAQITVINNDKVYNLLKLVTYRKELKEKGENYRIPIEKSKAEPSAVAMIEGK